MARIGRPVVSASRANSTGRGRRCYGSWWSFQRVGRTGGRASARTAEASRTVTRRPKPSAARPGTLPRASGSEGCLPRAAQFRSPSASVASIVRSAAPARSVPGVQTGFGSRDADQAVARLVSRPVGPARTQHRRLTRPCGPGRAQANLHAQRCAGQAVRPSRASTRVVRSASARTSTLGRQMPSMCRASPKLSAPCSIRSSSASVS